MDVNEDGGADLAEGDGYEVPVLQSVPMEFEENNTLSG